MKMDDLFDLKEKARTALQSGHAQESLSLAKEYAMRMHDSIGQKRKYTNEPYWVHLFEVEELVREAGGTLSMRMAALLHDVVEDVGVPLSEIESLFGFNVRSLVEMLTDPPSTESRKMRKEKTLERLKSASVEAKTIKLADIISNTKSVAERDPNFAKVYMQEKRELLKVLSDGNLCLYTQALSIVDEFFKKKPCRG